MSADDATLLGSTGKFSEGHRFVANYAVISLFLECGQYRSDRSDSLRTSGVLKWTDWSGRSLRRPRWKLSWLDTSVVPSPEERNKGIGSWMREGIRNHCFQVASETQRVQNFQIRIFFLKKRRSTIEGLFNGYLCICACRRAYEIFQRIVARFSKEKSKAVWTVWKEHSWMENAHQSKASINMSFSYANANFQSKGGIVL